ncbi:MAG: hypothetical protein ACYDBV_14240 [Nitrospiria bacterium]
MDENKTLVSLLNPPFTFKFADREFQVKKANLSQVQQYILRVNELSKDKQTDSAIRDLNILSYCIFLILYKADNTITEEFVNENMPAGAIDGLQLLSDLGFIDPQKARAVRAAQEKLISGFSSLQSLKEQGGLQEKSEN